MSRITISSSASAGWPGMPSRLDHSPSFMWPPPARAASSQCWARVTPRPPPYSRARRMSRLSCTPVPSSVNRRTPRAAISAIGASRSPARPTVMAPATSTSHRARRPRCWTSRTTLASSMAGSVLGMATTAVYPPRAAAREPVSTVSASSRPGWRRWVWRSTRPGATTHPPASSSVSPDRSGPTATTHPSSITTSARRRPVASITSPPRITRVTPHLRRRRRRSRRLLPDPPAPPAPRPARAACPRPARPEQLEQHRHAHRHPVGHLLGDDRTGQGRHLGGDLDAAVHRAGVHDEGVGRQPGGPLEAEAVAGRVLPQRRHQRLLLAFELHPQQVAHVELGHDVVEVA